MGNRQAAVTIEEEHTASNGRGMLSPTLNESNDVRHSKISSTDKKNSEQKLLKSTRRSKELTTRSVTDDEKENTLPNVASSHVNSRPQSFLSNEVPQSMGTAAKFKPRKKKAKASQGKPVQSTNSISKSSDKKPTPHSNTPVQLSPVIAETSESKSVSASQEAQKPPPPPPSRFSSHSLPFTVPSRWATVSRISPSILSDSSCALLFSAKTLPAAATLYKQPICVNDDHLFPDAVTPSKVKHCLPQGFYDVPFIDDEAFIRSNWYRLDNKIEIAIRNPLKASIDELNDSQTDISLPPSTDVTKRGKQISDKRTDGKRKSTIRPLSLCSCVSNE